MRGGDQHEEQRGDGLLRGFPAGTNPTMRVVAVDEAGRLAAPSAMLQVQFDPAAVLVAAVAATMAAHRAGGLRVSGLAPTPREPADTRSDRYGSPSARKGAGVKGTMPQAMWDARCGCEMRDARCEMGDVGVVRQLWKVNGKIDTENTEKRHTEFTGTGREAEEEARRGLTPPHPLSFPNSGSETSTSGELRSLSCALNGADVPFLIAPSWQLCCEGADAKKGNGVPQRRAFPNGSLGTRAMKAKWDQIRIAKARNDRSAARASFRVPNPPQLHRNVHPAFPPHLTSHISHLTSHILLPSSLAFCLLPSAFCLHPSTFIPPPSPHLPGRLPGGCGRR